MQYPNLVTSQYSLTFIILPSPKIKGFLTVSTYPPKEYVILPSIAKSQYFVTSFILIRRDSSQVDT